MAVPPVGQSVYDLREDEQLALAMQQSLAEEADPDAHSSEAAVLTPDTGGAPEMVQPVQQTAMLQRPAPPERPPDTRPREALEMPMRSEAWSARSEAKSSDPEWAGSAEEAAGAAPMQHPVPPRQPAFSHQDAQLLDQVVHQALDLTKNRQFAEAERCLAQLASEHPELADSKEMKAAHQTVAICKQLNDS
mmetsp:Transcript_75761/g.153443  ORF Transcript_75761/g.153443 Transcript_75761/m.153443 type:complete len:191 (+) Transcript_75761:107-679(+)